MTGRSDVLSMDLVGKGYGDGAGYQLILDHVSLQVAAGEIAAVIGHRWEGKTTLLRLAAGIELADRGAVRYRSRDFADYPRGARGQLLGHEILWLDRQEPTLGLKVLDFIALPLVMGGGHRRGEVRRLAAEALRRVGVAHVADRRFLELSSWERVLVALARVTVVGPRLLLVDDLLDGLGATRTQEAGDLVRSLVQELGFAALVTLSDFDAALVADQVVTFDQRGLRVMSSHAPARADVLAFAPRVQPQAGRRGERAC